MPLPETVTTNLSFEFLAFGAILTAAFIGLFNNYPQIGYITLTALATGGVLCIFVGVRGLMGRGGIPLAKFTVAGLVLFGAARTVMAWGNLAKGDVPRMEPILCSLMVVFSLGLTMMTWKEDK